MKDEPIITAKQYLELIRLSTAAGWTPLQLTQFTREMFHQVPGTLSEREADALLVHFRDRAAPFISSGQNSLIDALERYIEKGPGKPPS